MDFSIARILGDISNDMLQARTFEDRWAVVTRTLETLGADAVSATATNVERAEPIWFRTTLAQDVQSAYVADGHHINDLILAHVLSHRDPLVWDTKNGSFKDATAPQKAFIDFVVDNGHRSIVCHSMFGRSENDLRTLAYCSPIAPGEVLEPGHLQRLQLVMSFLLPWIGWPETQNHPEFLRRPNRNLSWREVEALSFLAGGYLNARIADAMGITEATVAKHLLSARQKLGARTREQAIAIAVRDGHLHP